MTQKTECFLYVVGTIAAVLLALIWRRYCCLVKRMNTTRKEDAKDREDEIAAWRAKHPTLSTPARRSSESFTETRVITETRRPRRPSERVVRTVRRTRGSEDSSAPNAPFRPSKPRTLQDVKHEIEKGVLRERCLAATFGTLFLATLVCSVAIGISLTKVGFHELDEATPTYAAPAGEVSSNRPSDTLVISRTTFLLLRGLGLAGVLGGAVYFLAGLTRSAVDQATRYEKRRIASEVIDFALHDEHVEDERLKVAHEILMVWGNTVESAYTPPRVASRLGSYEFSLSKEGVKAAQDLGDSA